MTPSPSTARRLLLRVLPWAAAAAILYLLFRKYPPEEVLRAARGARWIPFLLYSAFYFLLLWAGDCLGYAFLLRRRHVPTKARELAGIRAASYLASIVFFAAGEGLFAYFLKKHKKFPLREGGRLVLLVVLVDLYWTVALAFAGTFFFPIPARLGALDLTALVRTAWILSSISLAALLLLPKIRVRPTDGLAALAVRLPIHLIINASFSVTAWTFGAHIPLLQSLAHFPLVVLIAALPITPGGLGTMQGVTVALFQDTLPGELLFSMTLTFTLANYFWKSAAGFFFLRKSLREETLLSKEKQLNIV